MQQKRDRIQTKKEAQQGEGDSHVHVLPGASGQAVPIEAAQIKSVSGEDKAQRLMDVLPDVGGKGGAFKGGGGRGNQPQSLAER